MSDLRWAKLADGRVMLRTKAGLFVDPDTMVAEQLAPQWVVEDMGPVGWNRPEVTP